MYKISIILDGKLPQVFQYSDALEAFHTYLFKCVDLGDAKDTATYNLSLPNGKMYSKTFNTNGFVSGK